MHAVSPYTSIAIQSSNALMRTDEDTVIATSVSCRSCEVVEVDRSETMTLSPTFIILINNLVMISYNVLCIII